MNNKKQKIIISILAILFLILGTSCIVILNKLGAIERVGYIEVLNKNEELGTYRVRINYYDKIFRNSDIYRVYVKTETLPDNLKAIKWISSGSPFGDTYPDDSIKVGDRIENIIYTLKVRNSINGVLALIILTSLALMIFNKQASVYYVECKNIGISKFIIKYYDKIFILAIIFCALVIRIALIGFVSGDYGNDIRWWIGHFRDNGFGGFSTIYTSIYNPVHPAAANYPPLQMFIIALLSLIPYSGEFLNVAFLKVPQIIMEFVLAFYVYKFIKDYTGKKWVSLMGFSLTVLSPLILFNSLLLGQFDVNYSTFAIISLYYLYKERYFKSFLLLGFSIAFKGMGIFVLPVFIVLTISKNINLKYYFVIIIPHLLSSILVSVFGAPFAKTFLILGAQRSYTVISMNAPNLPALLFDGFNRSDIVSMFILFAIAFCAIYLYLFLNKKSELKFDNFILWSLVISFAMPFILPRMHERFFFIAEVLAIIYAFMKPKYFYITALMYVGVISRYGLSVFELKHASLIMLVVFSLLLRTLYVENFKNNSIIEK